MRPDGATAALDAEGLARALDAGWLDGRRWYAGKGRGVRDVALLGALRPAADGAWLLAVEVTERDGAATRYALPAVDREGAVAEAGGEDPLWGALGAAALRGERLAGDGAAVLGTAGPLGPPAEALEGSRALGIDQSNTTVVLGGRLALKCYRVLVPGAHPEIELLRALTAVGFAHVPAVRGSAELHAGGGAAGLLLLQDLVEGRDGWLHAEEELGALLHVAGPVEAAAAPLGWARATGTVCARLHVALARALDPGGPPPDLRARRVRALARIDAAREAAGGAVADELGAAAPRLEALLAGLERDATPAQRVHGDLHLGQFLLRGEAAPHVVDFEGEPGASVAERSAPDSPLRDVAALLRSVDHAEAWVVSEREARGLRAPAEVAAAWRRSAREVLLGAYVAERRVLGAPLAAARDVLAGHEAAKAVDEFLYAARFLPSWIEAPRRGLRTLLAEHAA